MTRNEVPMLRSVLGCAMLLLVSSPTDGQTPAAPVGDPVTLQPGDLVRVKIWREEDLSGEFVVDQDGLVTLPLIGEKQVTGLPLRRLRAALTEDYRVHLRNPSIDITPLRRINLLGEVNKPGLYPVDPTVSLVEAVALAGGVGPGGDIRRIRIIRGGKVIREKAGVGETLNTLDIRSGDQILVARRGWFERNQQFVVGTLLSVTGLVVSIILATR